MGSIYCLFCHLYMKRFLENQQPQLDFSKDSEDKDK